MMEDCSSKIFTGLVQSVLKIEIVSINKKWLNQKNFIQYVFSSRNGRGRGGRNLYLLYAQ